MSPVTAAVIGLAIIAPQAPEMARIWAADRKDKRARAAARDREGSTVSTADDAREHLTATIWEVLRNYSPAPLVHHADLIHTAAERYGHAVAEDIADETIGSERLKTATEESYRRTP